MSAKKWYHILMSIIWEQPKQTGQRILAFSWANLSKDHKAQRMAEDRMQWHTLTPSERLARTQELIKLAQEIKESL